MSISTRLAFILIAIQPYIAGSAFAQHQEEPLADPVALKAFAELVESYRARPALTVKDTITIEMIDGDTTSNSTEVKGEFIFGRQRNAVVKLNGFTCYLNHEADNPTSGTITAVHEKTDHSYFTASDDGSPYYALLNAFKDMPFPELAIMLGEEKIDDVLLQFHPKALMGVVPTAVEAKDKDGKTHQHLTLTGESETIELWIDPATKLIESIEMRITGGAFTRPGTVLVYRHKYENQAHEQPLDASVFTFDPGQRQRVDLMMSLLPRRSPQELGGGGAGEEPAPNALVGNPAPPFVLSLADGKAVDLNDLRGRVVVLDYWATWCGPCMAALPKLHEVAKWASQEELPVTVLTVNVWEVRDNDTPDARLESAKATWKKRGFTLPIAMDYTDETAGAFGVRAIPTTIVIRSDGVVHAIHVGSSSDYVDTIKQDVRDAMQAVEP